MTIQVLETYNICTMEMNVQRSQIYSHANLVNYCTKQTESEFPHTVWNLFHAQFSVCGSFCIVSV